MPVPRAVATLAIPTVISQVVTMIYNLADTFFIGQTGDPTMVAAVSLVSPWFNLLTALGNLFGLGGSSLISRMLGAGEREHIRHVSAFCVWGGAAVTLCFSLLTFLAHRALLNFLGASAATYAYAERYLFWVVVLGGVPTTVSLILGHLLRSEGHARPASAGMMFGGILNVVLDPILIFVFDLDVAGAAIATAFSNAASVVFFALAYRRLRVRTAVSLHPRHITVRFARPVFSVGLASALATTLGNASNMVMVHLASGYGDIPVAAYGVVKRIDQFPLNVSMGLCQGFMPLVGYNYAAIATSACVGFRSFPGRRPCCSPPVLSPVSPPLPPASCTCSSPRRTPAPWAPVFAHRLPGGAADLGQLPHQLHAAGHGQGRPVGHPDLQPPGPAQHSAAAGDERPLRSLRHDLDPAGGGGDHAARLAGAVCPHLPPPAGGAGGGDITRGF